MGPSNMRRIATTMLVGTLALGITGCACSANKMSNESIVAELAPEVAAANKEAAMLVDYRCDDLGFVFRNPEGFVVTNADPENDGETVEYAIKNDLGSTCTITKVPNVTSLDGVTNTVSWAKTYGEALQAALEAQGQADVRGAPRSVNIGDSLRGANYLIESKRDDEATLHNDVFFLLGEDGTGLRIRFQTISQDDLNMLRGGLGELVEVTEE